MEGKRVCFRHPSDTYICHCQNYKRESRRKVPSIGRKNLVPLLKRIEDGGIYFNGEEITLIIPKAIYVKVQCWKFATSGFLCECEPTKKRGRYQSQSRTKNNLINNKEVPAAMKVKVSSRKVKKFHGNGLQNADKKSIMAGTPAFIDDLNFRNFLSADDIVVEMTGKEVTEEYFRENGFNDPIFVLQKKGLGMRVPPETFTASDVEHYVGPCTMVEVINVTTQAATTMKLRDFVRYFMTPERSKILNLISLEFSNTQLGPFVKVPNIVRNLDWCYKVLPMAAIEDTNLIRPMVEKYCLISVRDSYTDFHVDFGGSSVWYHLLWGEKIFYLIKPTPVNLSLYKKWSSSTRRIETFFGDMVEHVYKFTLKQGQTLIIPAGWIHSVLTTTDSLAFGGNFLNDFSISLQLKIYRIERRLRTARKFMYPSFEEHNWIAACRLLAELKSLNSSGKDCPSYILSGLKSLVQELKNWRREKYLKACRKSQIPACIYPETLLRESSKEIFIASRNMNSLHPPTTKRVQMKESEDLSV